MPIHKPGSKFQGKKENFFPVNGKLKEFIQTSRSGIFKPEMMKLSQGNYEEL